MNSGSQQTVQRRIRAGSLAFGIALLLRSDSLFDASPTELPDADPDPELAPDLTGRAGSLPAPEFGHSFAPPIPAMREPVPSLSETLVLPRTSRRESTDHRLFKSRALASSALSNSFAGMQGTSPPLAGAAFPPPQLSAAQDIPAQHVPASAAAEPARQADPSPLDAAVQTIPAQLQPAAELVLAPPESPPASATDDPEPGYASTAEAPVQEPPEPARQAQPEPEVLPTAGPAPVLAETVPPALSVATAAAIAPISTPGVSKAQSRAVLPPQPLPLQETSSAPAAGPELASEPAVEVRPPASPGGKLPQPVQLALKDSAPDPAPAIKNAAPQGPAQPIATSHPTARSPPLAQVFGVAGNPSEKLAARFGSSSITGIEPAVKDGAAPGGMGELVQRGSTAAAGGVAAPSGEGNALAFPAPGANPVAAAATAPGSAGNAAALPLAAPQTRQRLAGGAPPALSDDDELILELRLPGGGVADTIIGYGTLSGVYVPLGSLARTLDLAIVVSDDGMYASGWFLDEKRTLTIDLRQKQLQLLGKDLPFPADVFVARNGEMYMLADYLGELLPLDLKADLRDQSITITTREPFPFEERMAREERRNRISDQQRTSLAEVFPRERTEWRLIDFPLIDIEARAVSDRTLGDRGETDVRISADLAYLSAQTFFSASTSDGLTAARVELGRRDPDSRLLGPLRATEFQVGDVSTQALPIGLRGTGGRGAFVTNASLDRASVFDKIDLRGELPDGYEVELYRNNVLIASTRIAVNGRYEFLQVPVDFGLNVMRLVFFGPQGQRREEVRHIAVGDGRLAKGEFEYTFGVSQKDRNLFDVYGPFFTPTRDFGNWRMTGEAAYGFSKDLTGTLSVADFETDLGRRQMVAAGLRTGIGGLSLRLDAALQDRSSTALQVGAAGRLFGSAMTLSHAEYSGQFIDEVRAFNSDYLRRATELNFIGSIDLSLGKASSSLPYSLRARRLEFADGRNQIDAALRGSARLGTMLLSKSFEYQRNTQPGSPTSTQLTGLFDLARLSGSRLDLRGGFSYRILPKLEPLTASVQADYAIDDKTLVNATLGRSFESKETFLGLSATRRFDRFTLGFDSNYSIPNQAYSVALRLGFSLGRSPLSRGLFFDRPGLATSGAVAIRAFHDKDGDNSFGPQDEPLEGLEFFSGTQTRTTDKSGTVLIGDLPSGSRASLQLDADTIQDISLAPRARGFEMVPRPGRIHVKDFAIVEVSEVTGTAVFSQQEGNNPVSGLRLELIDGEAKVIAETRTESDGYFFFEQVMPGTYRVRIQPDQEARFGIAVTSIPAIEVKAGMPVPAIQVIVEKR